MRKLLILASFVLLVATAGFAQEAETKMWVGGSLSVINKNDNTTFNIIPTFGYHVNDTWSIGGRVNVILANDDKMKVTPFARYYFYKGDKFAIAAQGELPITLVGDGNGVEMKIKPVVTYSLNSKWALVGSMNDFVYFNAKDGDFMFKLINSTDILSSSTVGIVYKF